MKEGIQDFFSLFMQVNDEFMKALVNGLFALAGILITLLGNIFLNFIKSRLDNKTLQVTAEQEFRDDLRESIERLDRLLKEKDELIRKQDEKIQILHEAHNKRIDEITAELRSVKEENYSLRLENVKLTVRVKELEQKIGESH
jgi:predicted nuclease with TOPRIM domain